MESIIRWKTGTPTRGGRYLVVVGNNAITCDHWAFDLFQSKMEWVVYRNDEIKYWCRIESIKLNNKTEEYGTISNTTCR